MKREKVDRAVWRFALVTLVLPACLTTLGLSVQLVAETTSGWLPPTLTAVVGFGLPAVFGLSSLPSLRRGERSPTFRLFGAQALGLSMLANLVATFLLVQRLGSSGALAVWLTLLGALAVAVAVAVIGWLLQPAASRQPAPRDVVPLEIAASERASWMRTAFLPVPAVAVICAVIAVLGLKAGFGWAAGDRDGVAVILTAVAALLILLLAATAIFRVRVDAGGLSVRSVLGIPRFRVAAQDVGTVAVVDARSLGVRGSWGIRVFPDRVTIVTRSTTGIRVTRRDGGTFFVTVDDAATGAALLKALATSPND